MTILTITFPHMTVLTIKFTHVTVVAITFAHVTVIAITPRYASIVLGMILLTLQTFDIANQRVEVVGLAIFVDDVNLLILSVRLLHPVFNTVHTDTYKQFWLD